MLCKAIIHVSGIVQGVGFRPFVYRLAISHGLNGYVLNMGDAGVEIVVEGDKEEIVNFVRELEEKKPPTAVIHSIKVAWKPYSGEFQGFSIAKSSFKSSGSLSTIPPDVGICNACIQDILTPGRRWYNYPFTCCATCGPRFTIIYSLPYDRERTSMNEFPLCSDCRAEYEDPTNRRYHAEGICCPKCGPKMWLCDKSGELIDDLNPIDTAAKLIDEGYIIAVKGIGGFHIAAKTTDDDVVLKLRQRRRRPQQPFAIMSPDISTIKTFAIVGEMEEKLLSSYQRPIVLLRKSPNYYLSKYIAPGLHNIGVMLPYTGIHLLLLRSSREPALIMTSGNYPGEPMVTSNEAALKRLRNIVDYFLLHNRKIVNRCDDSVIRISCNTPIFIRRSRGYAPAPIMIKNLEPKIKVLAVGAELQVTGALLLKDKCFLTQHIGDINGPESLNFLEKSMSFLINCFKAGKIDVIVCDLHPGFTTTRLARHLAEQLNAELLQVQHHFAHLASLIAESGIPVSEPVVGIVIDGYGYGLDRRAWGGEIVLFKDGVFERLGQLTYQPMPGGDAATRYPARMLTGMLYRITSSISELRDFLISKCIAGFKRGILEIDAVIKQLISGFNVHFTSSLGRVLDAFSALFGVCYERTYEGEPAMKFESFAMASPAHSLKLEAPVNFESNGYAIIDTSSLLKNVIEYYINNVDLRALARAIHIALGKALAEAAISVAKATGAKYIGLSGGAAVNELILSTIKREVEKKNLVLLVHRLVPPGDGGLALGQAFMAALNEHFK